ncbi:glycosyl hydrolase 53 family protein [Streptosporangium sp. NPDC001682]
MPTPTPRSTSTTPTEQRCQDVETSGMPGLRSVNPRAPLNPTRREKPRPPGQGGVQWEPTWTAVRGNGWDPADASSGNGWENQALFDFSDRALPALTQFTHQ